MGRSREDSTEIAKKSISSHVARMTGGNLTFACWVIFHDFVYRAFMFSDNLIESFYA